MKRRKMTGEVRELGHRRTCLRIGRNTFRALSLNTSRGKALHSRIGPFVCLPDRSCTLVVNPELYASA